jgi:beta-galactosidase
MRKMGTTKTWLATGALCVAALSAKAQPITRIVPDGRPHKFDARSRRFFIDDEPTLLVAGEMHFGRALPEDWETRILQAKAMGLNTLSFYLFWNICEPREGEFVFTGSTDVRRMLQLCQKHGMWAILRPGPYCCAEWEYGGLPWWTAKYPDVKIRTNDPQYLAWCRRYLAEVAKQVADLDVSRGGPLLMVQIENEYGMVGRGNNDHLRALEQIFREVGFTGQLYTCDPFLPAASPANTLPGVIRGRNGLHNDRDYSQAVAANGDLPVFAPEVYTAWFSGWGQPIATRNGTTKQIVDWTTALLDKDASFCYYMFFGGTTWGFYNGCNEYLPVQTSYDYRAPVDEAGRTTEKFRALRELLSARLKITPPAPPPEQEIVTLSTIALTEHEPLLATLPAKPTRVATHPLSMEQLDQAYGCVLYRKSFPDGVKGTLELRDAMDYAIVMVNGRTVGKAFRGYGPDSAKVVIDEGGPATLDILVYNLGRISVIVSDRSQDRARKGLGGATLDGAELTDWQMYSLPLDSPRGLKSSPAAQTGPTFYRGAFNVAKPAGTFLDLRNWGFGAVWVNGHNLGRFWDRGALRSLYLPPQFQRAGRNEIVVLELHDAPKAAEIGSATQIIEAPAVPFPVVLDRPAMPPRPRAANP